MFLHFVGVHYESQDDFDHCMTGGLLKSLLYVCASYVLQHTGIVNVVVFPSDHRARSSCRRAHQANASSCHNLQVLGYLGELWKNLNSENHLLGVAPSLVLCGANKAARVSLLDRRRIVRALINRNC
jgi:hypothetical protein